MYLPVSPPRAVRAGWFAAWLAVVVVQAVLAVHSDLGGHPDEPGADRHGADGHGEHGAGGHGHSGDCGLCLAAAAATPALPAAVLPPAGPRRAVVDIPLPPVPAAAPVRTARQARAPPA